jgi:hypothetical protein
VTSHTPFEIHLKSGRRFVSTLEAAPGGHVTVVADGARETLAIADVVFMKPVGDSFWRQVDGAVDVGYSFTSASNSAQWSLAADIVRRRPGRRLTPMDRCDR